MGRRALLGMLAACLAAGPARAAAPEPFGHACVPKAGVRFCAPQSLEQRVPSFDGVPLWVDVTLPAKGNGPFPTVAVLHGLSSNRGEDETDDPKGGNRLNNVWYAKRGYAAMTLDMRGHGDSCGVPESRSGNCGRGWLHLADQRFEVRDIQYLLGLLVDQGIADPGALGSAGCSYGSVVTLQLALLRNRVRMPDGSYAPWRSEKGVPLDLKAAYAQCSISSWVATLGPNGRLLDYAAADPKLDRTPVGVLKATVDAGAGALLGSKGYIAPPFVDPTADFTTWTTVALADTPDGAQLSSVIDELSEYHQAMGIDISRTTPAPLLVQNGWADDYTPPEAGGMRMYRYLRSRDPGANIALQLTDRGHQRSKSKQPETLAQHTQGTRFFDHYLRGRGKRWPRPGSVMAYTQSCPLSAKSAGPFRAPTWAALHPGEVRFGDKAERAITELSADPTLDAQLDPVNTAPCAAFAPSEGDGVAVYRHTAKRAFTVLGLPTIDLDVTTSGPYGRLIARLWDEAPDGSKTLVTRGAYRLTPDQTGHVTFQLFGGGWRYEPGHTARMEIAGSEAPFFKPAEAPFTARISNVVVSLPTHERPDGGEIKRNRHQPPKVCRKRRGKRYCQRV